MCGQRRLSLLSHSFRSFLLSHHRPSLISLGTRAADLAPQVPAAHTLLATTGTDVVHLRVASVHDGTPTAMGTAKEARVVTTTTIVLDIDHLRAAAPLMTTRLLEADTTTHTGVTTLPQTPT